MEDRDKVEKERWLFFEDTIFEQIEHLREINKLIMKMPELGEKQLNMLHRNIELLKNLNVYL